mmetsp:Transcript_26375/g.99173  ORF Transcript_26375/g.99173 Transcript_26375/m.99173 type:complete len:294 (+) Transcript_26375:480-1361(+)
MEWFSSACAAAYCARKTSRNTATVGLRPAVKRASTVSWRPAVSRAAAVPSTRANSALLGMSALDAAAATVVSSPSASSSSSGASAIAADTCARITPMPSVVRPATMRTVARASSAGPAPAAARASACAAVTPVAGGKSCPPDSLLRIASTSGGERPRPMEVPGPATSSAQSETRRRECAAPHAAMSPPARATLWGRRMRIISAMNRPGRCAVRVAAPPEAAASASASACRASRAAATRSSTQPARSDVCLRGTGTISAQLRRLMRDGRTSCPSSSVSGTKLSTESACSGVPST